MRKLTSIALLLFAMLVSRQPVAAQSVPQAVAPVNPQVQVANPPAHPLQISSGDLLDVVVFDTPELSAKLRVDDRGDIALPLAGALSVSGLTAEQAARAIESKLVTADILKEPHVSITVLEYATQGVTVLGEVKSPGVYPLLGAHTLLDLLSAAGGVTPSAGKAVTITHRDQPDKPQIVHLQNKPGSTATYNVDVRPGDTIMVSHAGIVYVVGDVAKPGGFLIENNDRLTVLQAMALAQGANRTASLNSAKLLRTGEDGRQELSVPLKRILANKAPDQQLLDGDILFIPSSAAKTTFHEIIPAVAGAAIYRVP